MKRLVALSLLLSLSVALAGDWSGWRGPRGDGHTPERAPLHWDTKTNITWKIAVPGVGHSSPIVVGEKVLLTTYLAKGQERVLLCFDRTTGKELWRRVVLSAPAEKMHKANTPASATPVSDGKHVWTTFADGDKIAVTCHTLEGKATWQKKFAGWDSKHGFCGSPTLHDGLVIVNGDSDGDAFLAGLDAITGEQRWRIPRPNKIRSFSAPLSVTVDGKSRLVLAGSQCVVAIDPRTGKEFWKVDTLAQKFVATVAHADGVVLASGTSPESTLIGVDAAGKTLWSDPRGATYVPSPLGMGKHFLVVADNGLANLIEARSGKRLWTKRMGRAHDASPIQAGEHVYCIDIDGITWVLKAGTTFEVVAKNPLDEGCHATPAVSEGQLFLRTTGHLWCIGSRDKGKL
jgi:outer membrane protein assembly factor BamB